MSIIHVSDGRESATLTGSLAFTLENGVALYQENGTSTIEFDGTTTYSVIIEHIKSLPSLFHIPSAERLNVNVPLTDWILTNSAGEEILNSAGENIATETNDLWSVTLYHV